MGSKFSFGIAVTTAFTALGPASAFASHVADARLAIIDRALRIKRVNARTLVQDSIAVESAAQTQTYQFNIDGAPLQDVVAAFQRTTGGIVTVSTESINPIFSPGLKGIFTFEQGLRMLLEGTSITFRVTGVNAAMLTLPSLSESVSVSATSTRVVESPKYQAPLREIPQTIEVIPRAAMEAQGVTTLSEALRNVPGITMQAGEGGGASSTSGDMFSMRGFSAANSLFVDNVRDDGLISRDVFNMEQVEVFLGPTGSDVGRGNAAGYVNMQTKRPTLNNGTSATLAVGTAAQRRGTLDFNQSFTQGGSRWVDKSAFRLNAMWQDSGVPGRDEVTNESRAFAPSLALGIGTSTRVVASSQMLRQDNLPDYGIPAAAWRESQLGTSPLASRDVDQTIYFGSPEFDYDRADQTSALVRFERDLSPRMTITNQTRYNATNREAVVTAIANVAAFDAATEMVTLARQANARGNSITSNQTNLVARLGSGTMEHAFNAGVEFINENFSQPTLIGMGTRAPVSIYDPNPNDPVTAYAPMRNGASSDGDVRTVAAYASDSFSLGSKIRVNGSLRVERYDAAYRTVNDQGATTLDQSSDDTLVSGKLGAIYRLSPTGNVYVSYGTTMTPPGSVNFAFSANANNQNNPNTDPQQSSNLEAGVKWDVAGGRLALTGAVFHTVNKNVLFTVDNTVVPPVFNQDDKQQVDGATFGATGQLTRDWQIMTSVAYLDSQSLSQGPNNGMRLTLSPEWSGSVWTSYRLPKNVAVAGGVRGTTSTFYNAGNTIQAPGYKVVDALVEYGVNQHLTLRMNVYNLTDEIYVRNINNNGGRYNPGFRRTAQLSTVIAF